MLLRNTIKEVLGNPVLPLRMPSELRRPFAEELELHPSHATVLTGVRRSGKSTIQAQMMDAVGGGIFCNFEDTRLFGMGPDDFPTFLDLLDEQCALENGNHKDVAIFLDEVQELESWQLLLRALLDRGKKVCVTGSNASLLGKEMGTKLTGRHLSYEVFPFSYGEYLEFLKLQPGVESYRKFLDDGGFPGYLELKSVKVLQELLRDIIHRDIVARNGLREMRHVMNLVLFLFANTGNAFSLQKLSKNLRIPSVGQTSSYVEYLIDAYLLLALPKFSTSFKQRSVAPQKYYSIDNGMRRANSPQQPDLGPRLENAIAIHLLKESKEVYYAGEKDLWECDFVTPDAIVQVCLTLTPENRYREVRGLVEAARVASDRKAFIVTLDQEDRIKEDEIEINIVPAWKWILK